ncbi:MaoC family dehydratase [Nakamurella endophytica]|uniref:MaoC family dehydratase n=1 Tax=Nakamurella endophytica TaxID=1748367 RepID=UPI001667E287|nr:MaoC family dehydratase [Nakamurella endophytica]
MAPAAGSVAVGDELPPLTVAVTRDRLVRYAGASGDFNPIHWNDRVASAVGLPGVIAHGMLTMALAGRLVTDWVGGPGGVVELGVTFTRPVVVPNDDAGATVELTGVVGAVDEQAGTARIDVTARFQGQTVLGKARATVRLG